MGKHIYKSEPHSSLNILYQFSIIFPQAKKYIFLYFTCILLLMERENEYFNREVVREITSNLKVNKNTKFLYFSPGRNIENYYYCYKHEKKNIILHILFIITIYLY